MPIKAVFFDAGETLIDETRAWAGWADWLGVSHLTLFAVLGSVIERGEHHHRAFEMIRPGFHLEKERAARRTNGVADGFGIEDLYPDVAPCLRQLRAEGYIIGVAANQPAEFEECFRSLLLPVDIVLSSSSLQVEKPSPQFFAAIAEACGCRSREIAYVGDRLDNDVIPAMAAGMAAVFLRRGPWGYIQAARAKAPGAHICLNSLDKLAAALRAVAID